MSKRIMSKNKSLIPRLTLLLLLLSPVGSPRAQTTPSITVQFVARGMQPTAKELAQGDSHAPSFGHVFMIISIPTLHGPMEEAYGFYPKKETLSGVIKGPGMPNSEFRCGENDDCNPANFAKLGKTPTEKDKEVYAKFLKHFSESEDSVRIPITEEQRRKIIGEVDLWNHKEYRLTDQSCMDFVNKAVKDLGYPAVPRYPIQQPGEFLERLRLNIKLEDESRREREQQEAQRKTEEEATLKNNNPACESGVFYEIDPSLTWKLTFDGDVLIGERNDKMCAFRLSGNGGTWSGISSCTGRQPSNVVLQANESCSQITSSTPGFRLTRR
jgi:hypothetical protein